MQEIVAIQKSSFRIDDLPLDERQRLVDVFAWLIQEDKKQNPDFYQANKEE